MIRSVQARRHGLTLIELLMAIPLVTLIGVGAIMALLQMHALTQRVQARQQLHSQARVIYEQLSQEVSALQQTAACFVTSTAATAGDGGSLEVVFLRGKSDLFDYSWADKAATWARGVTDLVWTRWYWDGTTGRLLVSRNNGFREFIADQTWGPSAGMDYSRYTPRIKSTGPYNASFPSPFRNVPTPQRVTASDRSPATTLDANAYRTGATDDLGDYDELVKLAVPIASNCTAFRCDIVAQDPGANHSADPTAAGAVDSRYWADGIPVDGRVVAGNTDFAKRPRLIRIQFTLIDTRSTVSETFSFSFAAPAFAPRL